MLSKGISQLSELKTKEVDLLSRPMEEIHGRKMTGDFPLPLVISERDM